MNGRGGVLQQRNEGKRRSVPTKQRREEEECSNKVMKER